MARRKNELLELAKNPILNKGEDYDEPEADEDEDRYDDDLDKGRSVSGPRTKLASEDRFSKIERSIASLAKGVHAIATAQKAMLSKHEDGMDDGYGDDDDFDDFGDEDDDGFEDSDPFDLPDDDEGMGHEEKMSLGGPEPNDFTAEPEPRKAINHSSTMAKGRRRKLAKDDKASSFGETDKSVPGNRPFDSMETKEEDTVIQGGPGAGPGPVNKGAPVDYDRIEQMITRAVNRAVRAQRATTPRMGQTSMAPGVGTTSNLNKSEQGYDVNKMREQIKKMGFREANRLRIELGDLPAGVI